MCGDIPLGIFSTFTSKYLLNAYQSENTLTFLSLFLFISSLGYRGQKGERGEPGIGLPGSPGLPGTSGNSDIIFAT